MILSEMIKRRDQWQRIAEEDQLTFGAFHTVTKVDVEMRDMYNALIARMEDDASQPAQSVADMQRNRHEAEARRNEREDSGPSRIGPEV